MKKKTFLARVRWGALAMLATGGLLLTSCASDGFNEETFEGSVRNTQLENPSIDPSKNIYPTDDKSQTIIEWDVVFGARAYDCKVYDTTENPYVLVKDTVIDGRRFTVPRAEDHTYALYIQTLANTTLGNIDAPEPSLIQFDSFAPAKTIPSGTDLAAFFNVDPEDPSDVSPIEEGSEEAYFDLEPGGTYTLSEKALITNDNIAVFLRCKNKNNLPTIVYGETGSLVTAGPLSLKNIVLDCSASSECMLELSKEPSYEPISTYYRIKNFYLTNIKATGIRNSIFHDGNTKYCVVDFKIEDCVLQLATEAVKYESLIAFQAGGAKDFTVLNSTVYGNNAIAKYFVRYNNSSRLDRYGFNKDADFQTMTYQNNTFYGLLNSDGQWGNYSGIAGQAYSKFVVQKNIWYNCSKQIVRRMSGGRFNENSPRTFEKNTYWNDGADMSEDEASYDTGGSILTSDPAFEDATNADFTPTGEQQVENQTGDPRWFE